MSFACHSHVISMSLVCTCMSSVCHSCVLVCHPYVTRIYSYVIGMSLVCTRMSSVCHSYVLVCHPYVTRMYSYVIRMSLSSVCHSYLVLPWTFSQIIFPINKQGEMNLKGHILNLMFAVCLFWWGVHWNWVFLW